MCQFFSCLYTREGVCGSHGRKEVSREELGPDVALALGSGHTIRVLVALPHWAGVVAAVEVGRECGQEVSRGAL